MPHALLQVEVVSWVLEIHVQLEKTKVAVVSWTTMFIPFKTKRKALTQVDNEVFNNPNRVMFFVVQDIGTKSKTTPVVRAKPVTHSS